MSWCWHTYLISALKESEAIWSYLGKLSKTLSKNQTKKNAKKARDIAQQSLGLMPSITKQNKNQNQNHTCVFQLGWTVHTSLSDSPFFSIRALDGEVDSVFPSLCLPLWSLCPIRKMQCELMRPSVLSVPWPWCWVEEGFFLPWTKLLQHLSRKDKRCWQHASPIMGNAGNLVM